MNSSGFLKKLVPKILARTKRAFHVKNLIYTNMTLSAGISGVGDVIEQQLEKLTGKLKHYHFKRTVNMTIAGVSIGLFSHFWYIYLDKLIKGNTLGTVVKKIVVDQLVGSPLGLAVFFLTMAVIEESTPEELLSEVKSKGWKLYVAEWVLWPPAQFINFYFLPGKYRVLYDNCVSLISDIYFSFVKHEDKPEESF